MNGFQATRFLKSRVESKAIPIVMHTTLSDERDRAWGLECGANAFVVKDFEHMERLTGVIETLIEHPAYEAEKKEKISQNDILELWGFISDRSLFKSSIISKFIDVNQYMASLDQTVESIFKIIGSICDFHIGALLMKYQKTTIAYTQVRPTIYRADQKDFLNVTLNDYYERFPDLTQERVEEVILGIEQRTDFDSIRLDKEKIRAYYMAELKNSQGQILATLHLGNFVNNYFTEKFVENLKVTLDVIGTLIDNTLTFKLIREKESKIRNVFSKFVPSEIIDSLIQKQDIASLLVGEKRSVAILFSDIRSFTSISENNTAEAVVGCLNNYFDLMAQEIKKQGGIIDKFIGDAILSVFGAPVSYEDNAARAVKAAIGMFEALKKLDTSKLTLPKKGFQIGVGIHEGLAIVGNIGSKEKFDYTVIGDAVNLASRLEGVTKHYGQQLVVSEAVKERVENDMCVRLLDNVKVKGKAIATKIFGIPIKDREAYTPEVAKDYEKGLSMYKLQNWVTAIDYFNKVLKAIPEDAVAKIYIERCNEFMKNSPGKDWDGSIELDFK
jgi:adenylate cyclase